MRGEWTKNQLGRGGKKRRERAKGNIASSLGELGSLGDDGEKK